MILFCDMCKNFLFIIFAFLICGCSTIPELIDNPDLANENAILSNPLYIVAMNVETLLGKKNELVILDANTYEERNRTRLMDDTLFFKFSQDPLRRLWIGYAGTLENSTNRVDVFQPEGSLLKSLELCTLPNREIQFVSNRAFVPCERNGFRAQMAVVDLKSLSLQKMIELTAEPRFSLLSTATNGEIVLAVGGSQTHATALFVNPQSLDVQYELQLLGGADIFTIIVHDNKFYLLNRSSSFSPDKPIDLRIIEFDGIPMETQVQLAVRDPLLGLIVDEYLWTYHKPTGPSRAISRTNLSTGESENWPLPDYWWAGDMIMLNDKIVLTRRHSVGPNETDGLYEFNPETGELTQILELPGAHLLLAPETN